MRQELAKITKASLNIKDMGILTFQIFVNYENGGGQCIGGIALDDANETRTDRVGTAYGCELIRKLLTVLDVNDFSEMAGKVIYVLGEGENFSFKPLGIKIPHIFHHNDTEYTEIIFNDIAKRMIPDFKEM